MIAQPAAQRFMEQMGRGVMRPQRRPARMIDFEHRGFAGGDTPTGHLAGMNVQIADLLECIAYRDLGSLCPDETRIALLAAGFAIERRLAASVV